MPLLNVESRKRISIEEFEEINNSPENLDKRFEYIDGHIYLMASPSAIHAHIVAFFQISLGNQLRNSRCMPITNLDIHFSDDDETTILCPDLFTEENNSREWCQFCAIQTVEQFHRG
jgi:Uma2 family endonuclease